MKLWQKGLITLVVGLVLNSLLMSLGVQGILRELTRLTSLVGIVVTVIGLIVKK